MTKILGSRSQMYEGHPINKLLNDIIMLKLLLKYEKSEI